MLVAPASWHRTLSRCEKAPRPCLDHTALSKPTPASHLALAESGGPGGAEAEPIWLAIPCTLIYMVSGRFTHTHTHAARRRRPCSRLWTPSLQRNSFY